MPSDIHYTDTYSYMEDLVAKGKTKMIGVSNFNIQVIFQLLLELELQPKIN